MWRNCPQNPLNKKETMHNIHEVFTIDYISYNIPRINEALDDSKANQQSTMVKIQGKIFGKIISVLIHSGSSLIYPSVIVKCGLNKGKQLDLG